MLFVYAGVRVEDAAASVAGDGPPRPAQEQAGVRRIKKVGSSILL